MEIKKDFTIINRVNERQIYAGASNAWPFIAALTDENSRAFQGRVEIHSWERVPHSCAEFEIKGTIFVWSLLVKNILYTPGILFNIKMEDERKGEFHGFYSCQNNIGRISVLFDLGKQELVIWPDIPITSLDKLKLGDRFKVNPVACEKKLGELRLAWLLGGRSKDTFFVVERRMMEDYDPMKRPPVERVRFGSIINEEEKESGDKDEIEIDDGDDAPWLRCDHLFLSKPNELVPTFVRV